MDVSTLKESPRFDILENILNSISEYFKPIERFMQLYHPDQHKYFLQLTADATNELEASRRASASLSSLDDVITLYGKLGKVQSNVGVMLDIIKNPYYSDLLSTGLSQAHHQRLVQVKFDIAMEIAKMKQKVAKEDETIFAKLTDSLDLATKYETVVEQLRKYDVPNRLIIYIIKRMLQVADCEQLVRQKLEQFKNVILETPVQNIGAKMPTSETSMEWIVNHRGLIPVTPYEDATKALKDIGVEHSEGDALDSLKKTTKYIVVINKGYGREIDFNYLTVLDDEYIAANELHTKRTSGVNKKIWKRFNVINPVPTAGLDLGVLSEYGQRNAECTILETPNGKQFRRLGLKYGDMTVSSDVVNAIKNGIHLRAGAYHDIMEFYILNRAGEVKRNNILQWYDELKTKAMPTDSMKKAVLQELVEKFNVPKKHTVDDFVEAARTGYESILAKHVLVYLGEDRLMGRETKATFAVKLSNLMREFNRQLNTSVRKIVHPALFTKRADMDKHLRDVYRDIMQDAIEGMDAPPSKWQGVETSLKEFYLKHKFAE